MRVPPAQSSTARRHAGERHVDVAVAQLARDVGEPRAEHQRVHAVASLVIACRKCSSMRA